MAYRHEVSAYDIYRVNTGEGWPLEGMPAPSSNYPDAEIRTATVGELPALAPLAVLSAATVALGAVEMLRLVAVRDQLQHEHN